MATTPPEALRLPPSTAAIAFATAIIAGLGGFFLGQARSLGLFGNSSTWPSERQQAAGEVVLDSSEFGSDSEADDDDDEDEPTLGEKAVGEKESAELEGAGLSAFEGREGDEYKLVLVVRTDLGMGKGKIAAQCSHATLACYKSLLDVESSAAMKGSSPKQILRRWERQGQAKVALQVRTEDELVMLQAQAVSLGLCAEVVHDAGRTQIAAGSATVLGVGPGPKGVVDLVTGGLKLL